MGSEASYVVLKDVAGDEGFIDARVFVRFQMLEGIFRDTFVLCGLYMENLVVSKQFVCAGGCRERERAYLCSVA